MVNFLDDFGLKGKGEEKWLSGRVKGSILQGRNGSGL